MSEYLGKYIPDIWDEDNDVRYPKHFLKLLEEYSAGNHFDEGKLVELAKYRDLLGFDPEGVEYYVDSLWPL